MIRGCLRNVFVAIGCATVLVLGSMIGWQYRAQFAGVYRAFRGLPVAPVEEFGEGPGSASAGALRSARRKYEEMSQFDGPESVSMSAAEIASLIRNGLDPTGRRALDSLTVTLEDGRFVMRARLVTEVWGRDALGLLGGFLQPYEPLRVAGPARMERIGILAWEPLEFSVRSIPVPRVAIPPIVNRLTGGDNGLILLGVPAGVTDVRIVPGRATFYRRKQ